MTIQSLKKKFLDYSNKYWPFAVILLAVVVFFYPVFFKHLVPIPGDFIVGTYFPWLDYKWGNVVGVPVKNPITSDVVSVLYPLRILAIDLIKSGTIPLWNSTMLAGYPLLANLQVAIFSPTILLYLFLPDVWAWTGQIILQPLLACIFTYLLLRHFKLSKISSIFGGLAYAFSGFNIIWLEWNAHALVAAFIPLIVLVVDKIVLEKKLIYGLLLSALIALQFFSGYPQLVVYTAISAALLLIFRLKQLNVKALVILASSSVLAALLVAVQLLPAMELLANSQRVSEYLAMDRAFLPFRSLISFLAPDYFGNHVTGNFWGTGDYTNNIGYSGIITLTLAFIASVSLFKKTEVKYLLSILFITLLLALENPISVLIWESKILGSGASSSARILVLTNLSLACLAAFAVELVKNVKNKIFLLPNFIVLLVISTIFLVTFLQRGGEQSLILQNNYMVGIRNLLLPFVLTILLTAALIVRNIYHNTSRVGIFTEIFILLLLLLELFRFGWKFTPFSKTEYIFPETPVINYLENLPKPTRILAGNTIPMNMWVPYGLESLAGYDAVYPELIAKYIAVSNSGNPEAPAQGRYGRLDLFTSKLTDIANGEYLLLNNKEINDYYKDLIEKGELKNVFTDKSVSIYKKGSALPRAYFVTQWSIYSGKDIIKRLLDNSFNPSKEIVLEKQPSIQPTDKPNLSYVNYLSYSPNESTINVSTQETGFLFVSDTWYPGWKAFVDGNETEIYRANYAFRAVNIPKGIHKVVFIYDPKSIKIGSSLSLLALVILLTFLSIYEYKTRRGGTSS